MDSEQLLLSAVSANARQLYLLLRCINFASFAQVQITNEGLRFSVEESSVMEGSAFLEHTLFTTYKYNPPQQLPSPSTQANDESSDQDDHNEPPPFQISLPSLLETLQILGLTDSRSDRYSSSRDLSTTNAHTSTLPTRTAFSSHILGLPTAGLCRITYAAPGSPLRIHIAEPGVSTTCDLTTYEPDDATSRGAAGGGRGGGATIPFARDRIALKIIMRSSYLHDALTELASTQPERLVLVAQKTKETTTSSYFGLEAEGPLGSANVEFSAAATTTTPRADASFAGAEAEAATTAPLLETFQVARGRCRQAYKFSLVRNAARAMQLATKVSVRVDEQGVLSLQFMIEVEGSGDTNAGSAVSFIDFRFVPFISDESESEEQDGQGDNQEGEATEDEL